jgi:hypothetical protein
LPTDLAKPVGAWAGSQPLIPTGQTIFVADAHRDDGKRFIVHADEKLSAFVELERQVLTVTFYLASVHASDFVPVLRNTTRRTPSALGGVNRTCQSFRPDGGLCI